MRKLCGWAKACALGLLCCDGCRLPEGVRTCVQLPLSQFESPAAFGLLFGVVWVQFTGLLRFAKKKAKMRCFGQKARTGLIFQLPTALPAALPAALPGALPAAISN